MNNSNQFATADWLMLCARSLHSMEKIRQLGIVLAFCLALSLTEDAYGVTVLPDFDNVDCRQGATGFNSTNSLTQALAEASHFLMELVLQTPGCYMMWNFSLIANICIQHCKKICTTLQKICTTLQKNMYNTAKNMYNSTKNMYNTVKTCTTLQKICTTLQKNMCNIFSQNNPLKITPVSVISHYRQIELVNAMKRIQKQNYYPSSPLQA